MNVGFSRLGSDSLISVPQACLRPGLDSISLAITEHSSRDLGMSLTQPYFYKIEIEVGRHEVPQM